MEAAAPALMTPLIQYGFAGFSVILLGIIVWLIGRLLQTLQRNIEVIAHNTDTIEVLGKDLTEMRGVLRIVNERMIAKFGGDGSINK